MAVLLDVIAAANYFEVLQRLYKGSFTVITRWMFLDFRREQTINVFILGTEILILSKM